MRLPCSFLPLLAAGAEWYPEIHSDFPLAFRAASRQLLLINHCRGFGAPVLQPALSGVGVDVGGKGEAPCCQGGIQVPEPVLLHILRLAAQPLPAWVPELSPSMSES